MSIGFTLPLQNGPTGYFEVSEDILTQLKSNFINLLLTVKGERVHNPTFGCDINKLTFNFNDDSLYTEAKRTVEDAVSRWMPYMEIEEFEIESTDSDKEKYGAKIYIKYRLTENPNLKDEVLVQL